jgi:ribosomal protein L20A (L18A)
MKTVTINNVYALLQEMNHRLKTMEIEIQELREEPELREDYIKKLDEIEKQPSIHVGTVEDLRNRYKEK